MMCWDMHQGASLVVTSASLLGTRELLVMMLCVALLSYLPRDDARLLSVSLFEPLKPAEGTPCFNLLAEGTFRVALRV